MEDIEAVNYFNSSNQNDSCCRFTPGTAVIIDKCQEFEKVDLNELEPNCTGRLLKVDVTVNACEKREVIVWAIIYDKSRKKILRFKSCEGFMPESTIKDECCVKRTFTFYFVFQENLCTCLPLKVRTIVEYKNLDFLCKC